MKTVKRILYRRLSLEAYLRVLSCGFFAGLWLGVGRWIARRSAAYEYPQYLRRLVHRGDVAIDIGANLGYYSRVLSRLVGAEGKVYAVEPVKPVLGVLERNLRGCRNVEILPFALGEKDGTVTMVNDSALSAGYLGTGRNRVSSKSAAEAFAFGEAAEFSGPAGGFVARDKRKSRSERGGGGERTDELQFEVEMRRGSEIFGGLERLDFLKCDIEGYELTVLTEMAGVIERLRPVCLVETGGANRRRVIEIFRSLGYAGYVLQRGRLTSVMRARGEKDIIFMT